MSLARSKRKSKRRGCQWGLEGTGRGGNLKDQWGGRDGSIQATHLQGLHRAPFLDPLENLGASGLEPEVRLRLQARKRARRSGGGARSSYTAGIEGSLRNLMTVKMISRVRDWSASWNG